LQLEDVWNFYEDKNPEVKEDNFDWQEVENVVQPIYEKLNQNQIAQQNILLKDHPPRLNQNNNKNPPFNLL
jgi:hypothetical protein